MKSFCKIDISSEKLHMLQMPKYTDIQPNLIVIVDIHSHWKHNVL